MVGTGLVRYQEGPRNDVRRLRKLTWIPYASALVLLCVAGFLNPIGFQLMWQSALSAAAGAHSGVLWLMYYIPRGTAPERGSDGIGRSQVWIIAAVVLSFVFVFVLEHGITPHL